MLDLKILNGNIVDLENKSTYVDDINIKDGKIVSIGKSEEESKETIDASGYIVSPGFIDIHLHEESIHDVEGESFDIADPMIRMGVTTGVGGNCGSNKQSLKDFIQHIDKNGSGINYMMFLGHNYLRNNLNIDYRREANEEEIKIMSEELGEALDLGALGISFGIEYSPGVTLVEILKLLEPFNKRKDLLLAAHYRSDGPDGVDALREMCEIGKASEIPFQISHISSCTAFGNMKEALEMIESYRKKDIDVTVDAYPYGAFSTAIGSAVFEGNFLERWNKDYDSIILTEDPYKNVACTEEIFNDARENYPRMYAIANVMNEDEVIMSLKKDYVMVGSDGGYRNLSGHPRGAGAFPRVLGRYVREMGELDFYDALYKMTLFPARRLRIDDIKGKIEKGYDADIVIFDKEKIIDCSTFNESRKPPLGIKNVILNGEIAVENGEIVKNNLGKFIRRR